MVSAKLPQISSKIFGIKKFIEAHENPIYIRVWDELTIKYSLKIFSLFPMSNSTRQEKCVLEPPMSWVNLALSLCP